MTILFWVSLVLIVVSMAMFVYRLIKGPTAPDRVIALDAMGVTLISMIALLSILVGTNFYLEIILLLAILSFIGTVAFSKFIEKGEVFDRGNSD
ncbi:Na(+)/H(+) antiporter subunit F1 [Bhargavaea beijingensis]|uniref:Multisubunit sodium/proton antiporter, MrpF subunit (TC 2.A.63.1) n=1 Tax=Bhargavaea beijingensis TaxID=426756 RepID=A0A1G7F1S4_9BACL|nr:Na(+)/H(+) antiporter subunit F1 [Bhargavaea beijingensis]MCW1927629.1 Na(+)/H(+) antiporter subunit F1 [Bhargavaea beijingensis]RSK23978.1 Na(+)/H(+) antiporter subunit F1 [Bhargavaea beijingensis]SDE69535.1 multisubunit sodium/proton antiporter, MrpF subunit (TC 2.A.63.1) [Bhargavaea beijingensis]